ncbi:TetR/AcrR family transcriptional regulator [Lactobacillus sp. CC-MHH1034]|uniref:TetR/AcrR family transcriptional regulator n=1 Tax=Agrilactobacillus fermenti TaxID=2586909 RepID=UPI001E4522D1|nr:TetR/AcrR family transcriptional regulator [Agrilactobacillus fermenti]MCD2255167.1 TetR/AcrR family transcriptional regulator [Agrilactobacillus fermenti]
MARKKTITRQNILDAAFELVLDQGFSNFTARNIAKWMSCSTQPIYLEFSCMDELKHAVLKRMQDYLVNEVYNQEYCDDGLINVALSYINLARTNNNLYKAIFVEDHFGVNAMRDFTYQLALSKVDDNPAANNLPRDRKLNLVTGCWIIATGMASLISAGYIDIRKEQMINMLKAQIQDFIENDRLNSEPSKMNLSHLKFDNKKVSKLQS